MTEFRGVGQLPHIPDHLTIPQFFLDTSHPLQPVRPDNVPYFIEDVSGRKMGYTEVRQRTRDLANGLKIKYNISDNDVVCLFSPNHVDYPIAIWAVHRLGAILSPSNPGYTIDELVYQLETTNAKLIITFSGFLPTAKAAARAVGLPEERIVVLDRISDNRERNSVDNLVSLGSTNPSSFTDLQLQPGDARTRLAFLSFSSGTTGKAKAVKIPHYAVIANVLQTVAHWKDKRVSVGDVSASVLPFFHIYGLVVTLHYMIFAGASLVIIPKFSLIDYLKSVSRHRTTHLCVVPPQVVLLTKHPAVREYDLSGIKLVMCGAAPLSGELLMRLVKIMPNADIGQGYGLTETCTTISMFPATQKTGPIGSAGALLPGITARIIKEDGSQAREGEQGELLITGPSMSLGYLNNEQATKETFTDGWVRTGDEVVIRNNEVFIVDRLKEIMKVKGFQVAPAELEGHLLLHPSVADACVIGVPDEYSGEVPLAFVVLESTAKQMCTNPIELHRIKNVLKKHVSDHKVNYKWLAGGIEFVESIPKNPSGKILRRLLRDQARNARLKNSVLQIQAKL